jgi:hypothetical protein
MAERYILDLQSPSSLISVIHPTTVLVALTFPKVHDDDREFLFLYPLLKPSVFDMRARLRLLRIAPLTAYSPPTRSCMLYYPREMASNEAML